MNELISKIIELNKKHEDLKIKQLLKVYLKNDPNNIDLLLRLGVFVIFPGIADPYEAIDAFELALKIDKNNVIALLGIAYVNNYCLGGVNEKLFFRINSVDVVNNEELSMLKYVASWFYEIKNDNINQEKLLKESIFLCDSHVYNYVGLAKLYIKRNKKNEGIALAKKALSNIKNVYSENYSSNDPTDYNEFINEGIKGIHITKPNLEFIKELTD